MTQPAARSPEEIICRFDLDDEAPRYGRVHGDLIQPLTAAPWAGGCATGPTVPLAGVRLLAPCEPRNILCLANAYVGKDAVPPRKIRWFAKNPGAVAADGDTVEIPPVVGQLKAEAEVVIVIGTRVKNADETLAHQAIFGYAAGNEIFGFPESFQQLHHEDPARPEVMLAAGLKLGDRFAPFGPFIHRGAGWRTRQRSLIITNATTGKKLVHHDDTSGLLYSPARIVSELSRVLPLEPGDVIFTGANKALVLDAGDEVTVEIEGLGRLRNRIVRAQP